MALIDRLKHGWNAFVNNRDPTVSRQYYGDAYYRRPDRVRFTRGNEKTITTAIYNRIAMDAASIDIRHVKLDEHGRYKEDVDSPLNECLKVAPNIDQTPRAFKQDAVMSMLDEGSVAIVPIDTEGDPKHDETYDIYSMRIGKVVEWFPSDVKVEIYNDRTGKKEQIVLPKKMVTIVENPLYAIVNESNSVMQRLVRTLALLDQIDEQSSSGKLDLIIQLPYTIKSDARRKQADDRRQLIEEQLSGSKYGIAYADAAEKITQLNRPLENNLLKQIEYLTNLAYGQLGITQSVMDGTADEKTMLNYTNRTLEPIISAIVEGMHRTFISYDARREGQAIMFFRDPFKLVPVNNIAEIADKFTRNEILTSNEIRQIIGFKPSDDPKADKLINSNIAQPTEDVAEEYLEEGENQNGNV